VNDQEDFRLENREKLYYRMKAEQLQSELARMKREAADRDLVGNHYNRPNEADIDINNSLDKKFREIFEEKP
jgi:hypothetical protein